MRINRVELPQSPTVERAQRAPEPGAFQTVLGDQLRATGLQFSRHALERLQQRGISMNAGTLRSLEESVRRAETKGARTTLILLGDLAFVVSIENKKVITVADSSALQDRVFTNLDSVVVG